MYGQIPFCIHSFVGGHVWVTMRSAVGTGISFVWTCVFSALGLQGFSSLPTLPHLVGFLSTPGETEYSGAQRWPIVTVQWTLLMSSWAWGWGPSPFTEASATGTGPPTMPSTRWGNWDPSPLAVAAVSGSASSLQPSRPFLDERRQRSEGDGAVGAGRRGWCSRDGGAVAGGTCPVCPVLPADPEHWAESPKPSHPR